MILTLEHLYKIEANQQYSDVTIHDCLLIAMLNYHSGHPLQQLQNLNLHDASTKLIESRLLVVAVTPLMCKSKRELKIKKFSSLIILLQEYLM